jgi:hypothetical protein
LAVFVCFNGLLLPTNAGLLRLGAHLRNPRL